MFSRSRLLPWLPVLLALLVLPGLAPADERYEGVERVVAFGDVHGAHGELVDLLRAAGVVDSDLAWSGGTTHLVSLGDLIHRGDDGRQVMDLLMRLQFEAEAAGGRVHVLLGNHEVMSLTGDLRYVSRGDFARFGEESAGDLPPGSAERIRAFAPDGTYGRWLLERPLMVVVNDSLFVHGGLSRLLHDRDLDEINGEGVRDLRHFAEGWHALLDDGLVDAGADFREILARAQEAARDRRHPPALRYKARDLTAALSGLPFHPEGPLWYRGTSLCHPYTETDVARQVLERVGAVRVVMGHTPTAGREITSRMQGRAYRIDSGMNTEAYQGRAAALVIEGDEVRALYADSGTQPVAAEPNRVWERPYGMSDADMEDFLKNAEVTEIEKLDEGVTRPRRITLERDGRTLRAVFKIEDTNPRLEKDHWSRPAEKSDRYGYDVAAYRLDRMLGLEMVPVAVERHIRNEDGMVQYWVENSFNENRRQDEDLEFDGHCDLSDQYNLMNVFDILVYNRDRNLGNILYDQDWMIWLIDHTRAFGTRRAAPSMIGSSKITLTPEIRAMLNQVSEGLDRDPLRPYLHRRQIRAVEVRAEWMLREY